MGKGKFMSMGKGKGSIYEIKEKLQRGKQSKEDKFMDKEDRINDRFARNNSHVVYFKDTCYKVSGSATFEGGYTWRCGHAKYHISPDEVDPNTDEHYIFMVIGDKTMKMENETVEWPEFDEDIFNETMSGRTLISREKWKHAVLAEELTLKMKDDLHHIRAGKTRKKKAEYYGNGNGGKRMAETYEANAGKRARLD